MTNSSKKMLTKEFAEKVGLKDYQVKYYCDQGLLNPERTGKKEVGNDRRLFKEEDLIRMEQILIFKHLGVSREKLKEVFSSDDYDSNRVLEEAILALKRRIRHDQNLVLVAQVAQLMGTSFFAFGSFDRDDIDRIAETIRSSSSFKLQQEKMKEMSEGEQRELSERLNSLLFAIAHLKDSESNSDEQDNRTLGKAVELAAEFCKELTLRGELNYGATSLFLGISFMGDGELSSWADELGGDGSADFCSYIFLIAWLKSCVQDIIPLLNRLSQLNPESASFGLGIKELKKRLSLQVPPELCVELSRDNGEVDPFISMVEMLFSLMNDLLSDSELANLVHISPFQVPESAVYEKLLSALSETTMTKKGE